jgi:hypothetical protein
MPNSIINIGVPVGIQSVTELPNSEDCGYVSETVQVEVESEEIIPLSGEAQQESLDDGQLIMLATDNNMSQQSWGGNALFFAEIPPLGAPIAGGATANLVDNNVSVWGNFPTPRFFSVGNNLGTSPYTGANGFFANRGVDVAVWNQDNTIDQWIGFSVCLDIPADGQYWFGLAGDNEIRASLNGVKIIANPAFGKPSGTQINETHNFYYWWVFPLDLTAGENVLVLEGYNWGSAHGFGCDIVGPFFQGDPGYITSVADYAALGESAVLNIYQDNLFFTSRERVDGETFFDTEEFTCDHITDPQTGAPADCIFNACTNECICADAYQTVITYVDEIVETCGGTDCWTINVVDENSGLPVSGYPISIGVNSGVTDLNGSITFDGVPPGTYFSEFGGVSGSGTCAEIDVTLIVDFPYKRFYCVLQNLANKLIRNCETCKDSEIEEFMKIYSLYRTLELGVQNDCEDVEKIEAALDRLIINLDCSSCEKCF